MKNFWAWLATCVGVLVLTTHRDMFLQSPFPYFASPSKNNLHYPQTPSFEPMEWHKRKLKGPIHLPMLLLAPRHPAPPLLSPSSCNRLPRAALGLVPDVAPDVRKLHHPPIDHVAVLDQHLVPLPRLRRAPPRELSRDGGPPVAGAVREHHQRPLEELVLLPRPRPWRLRRPPPEHGHQVTIAHLSSPPSSPPRPRQRQMRCYGFIAVRIRGLYNEVGGGDWRTRLATRARDKHTLSGHTRPP
ncbi:hypothetical protein BHE74_00018714 [Ensete ventricosum]|nr:hypothetical protein GW17_00031975 [Ensete ventricosum]RWW73411.1 hypothetical protein BHE74_00018714 [Ensete ventricosum]